MPRTGRQAISTDIYKGSKPSKYPLGIWDVYR